MTTTTTTSTAGSTSTAILKRRRKQSHESDHQDLLPGLPDDIARLCLSLLPPSTLYSVCRSWRRLIYAPSFPPFLSLYALLSPTADQKRETAADPIEFVSFDPISSRWHPLPPPSPPLPPLLLRHPSFISRRIPIQVASISGRLVLLAATTHHFLPALSRPLIFDPASRGWDSGPPLSAPRRWCAAGSCGGAVYLASGFGSVYSPETARSLERWVPPRNQASRFRCKWEKMGGLRDGRFSREAIDAVGWRGKLCMVNVRGSAAKEGVLYDVTAGSPEGMPEGMLLGWRGPAAAMDEETLYCVDEAAGALRRYEAREDAWAEVLGPDERLKGAEQIAAGGGRVCVVCGGGGGVAVVDVTAAPPRLYAVDLPVGYEAVSVHVLPRMSQPESEYHSSFAF